MLRAAIAFFIIALIAMFFGMNGIAGFSADIGTTLLYVFLALAIISFIISLVGGRRSGPPIMIALALLGGMSTGLVGCDNDNDNAEETVDDAKRSIEDATD